MISRVAGSLSIVLPLVLAACARNTAEAPLVGPLERDRIEIVAEESEPILSLEVREGDPVTLGQVLMKPTPRSRSS
ncbi:MAG: hypothetical protein WDO68_29470 [Gammaproteobacteria bacterium]